MSSVFVIRFPFAASVHNTIAEPAGDSIPGSHALPVCQCALHKKPQPLWVCDWSEPGQLHHCAGPGLASAGV